MTRRKYTLEYCNICGNPYDPDDYDECPNCKKESELANDDIDKMLSDDANEDDVYDGLFS